MGTKRPRQEPLTGQQFATLHHVSVQAIDRAVARGVLHVGRGGRLDPKDPINTSWGQLHAARVEARANGSMDDARLAQLQGAVIEKGFDLARLQANTIETTELRVKLYIEADAVDTILAEFPERTAVFWDRHLGDAFGAALASAMADFRCRRGDQHQAVDHSLAKAAGAGSQYPVWRNRHDNSLDSLLLDLAEPATVAEAMRRHALVRGELARVRTRGRAGELPAARPARLAADGLRIGWWQEATEAFPAMYGPEILAAAGVSTDPMVMHAFWTWTHYLMAGGFGHTGLWPGLVRWPDLERVSEAAAVLRTAGERMKMNA